MQIKNFVFGLTFLMFAACSSERAEISGIGSTNDERFNPNRMPPGRYSQSFVDIPQALNDPFLISGAPWTTSSSLKALWSFEELSVFPLFSQVSLPPEEIVVAVIDTGIDKDHEDLSGRLWMNLGEADELRYNNGIDDDGNGYIDDFLGWDFENNTNNPADDNGHGTHVAGTIAAVGNNSKGIVGVAPWVRIMALKACNSRGMCSSSNIRAALAYAVANKAKVVNISLGAPSITSDRIAFDDAIAEATEAGTLVVVASGNSKTDASNITPANATHAITVGAHNNAGGYCSFSDYGWKVDLSAPGCGIAGGFETAAVLSLNSRKCGANAETSCSAFVYDDHYTLKKGTSMATPHVAGLAAVAWTISPESTPMQIRQALLRNTRVISGAASETKNYFLGMGKASATNLLVDAPLAPGIKITSPLYGSNNSSHLINFRIESRNEPVSWTLKYRVNTGNREKLMSSADNNLSLSSATSFSSGGVVPANTSVDLSEVFAPSSAGNYLVILEAIAGTRKYYDVTVLTKP